MAKTIDTITVAKPHTVKKFELIEKYVDEWARKILGFKGKNTLSGSKGIVYIDCMCNCGIYYDESGELIDGTAIRVAKRLNNIIQNYSGKKAELYFNDISSDRIEKLRSELCKIDCIYINIHLSSQDCNTFLKQFDFSPYRQYNTLMLYDPYDASIDWDAIAPFLNIWGEVIINHMVSDTTRGAILAKKPSVIERYQETYQKSIADIINIGTDRKQLDNIIVKLINDRINDPSKAHYIASFPFFNRNNVLVYNLIHCCNNIAGAKLFKKVAWQTFGGKSSLKNTHGDEQQLRFDLSENGSLDTNTDESCYFIKDIAKYIYEKYRSKGVISLETVYRDLDEHPIFPSDGYKNEIRNELKSLYAISISKGQIIFDEKRS